MSRQERLRWSSGHLNLRAAAALATLLAVPTLGWMWTDFFSTAAKVAGWQNEARTARAGEGTAALFQALSEAKLAVPDPATGRILAEDCDLIRRLAIEEAGGRARPDAVALKNLMRRFCATATGETIRNGIMAWNSAGGVIAVRDDRERGTPCEEGGPARTLSLPRGCHPAKWRILAVTPSGTAVPVGTPAQEPAPDVFGFAALGQHPGFGDWLASDTAFARWPSYRLETEWAGSPGKALLTVQLTGRLSRLRIGGETIAAPSLESAAGAALAGIRVKRQVLCSRRNRITDAPCSRDGTNGENSGETANASWRFTAENATVRVETLAFERLQPGEDTIPIVLEAEPLSLTPRALAGITQPFELRAPSSPSSGNALAALRTEGFRERYSVGNLGLYCRDDEQEDVKTSSPVCAMAWDAARSGFAPPRRKAVPAAISITAAGSLSGEGNVRHELLRQGATGAASSPAASPLAARLGIASWIGVTQDDPFALASALERQTQNGGRTSLSLTLDANLQAYVTGSLSSALHGSSRWRGFLPPRYDTVRRGAIVIMDAEDDPGALLAVAAWPQLTPEAGSGLHEWDLAALDRFAPAQSPLASRAWAETDQLAAPGSTFKVVSALALLQAAADGTAEARELLQGLDAVTLRQRFHVEKCPAANGKRAYEVDCIAPFGQKVRNFEGQDFASASVPVPCALDSAYAPPQGTIGLRQAIAKSSNIWFAGALPGLPATQRLGKEGIEGHPLAKAARRLYPIRGPGYGGEFPLIRGAGFEHVRRLLAAPVIADFLGGGPFWQRRLVLASYGQTVQTSPVAVAAIMASLALGRRVEPHLAGIGAPATAPLLEGVDTFTAERMLNEIRCGMAGVVTVGTAHRYVDRSLHGRLYGKTGTADVQGTTSNSVWFAGWLDGEPGTGVPRRIAFSCFLSHASGTGGETCAALMSNLLTGLRSGAYTDALKQAR